MRLNLIFFVIASLASVSLSSAGEANRLTYLDESDPYYVGRDFAKLTTEQWAGEPGVKAVVVLAIDDMRQNPQNYEAMLRPAMDVLKQTNAGRAPVSIMTNTIDPNDPKLQAWLKEGVSFEIHTIDHPCPLLAGGNFAKALGTYEKCIDLLATVPNTHPVAFRMPCCDSMDSPSPRFFDEMFNRATAGGNFLQMDSSVFNILTPNDPALPASLTLDADGREKARKYLPFEAFVNTIQDYPYPYLISRLCWEFPCVVPSDWEGQNLQKPNNPKTIDDMKAALDAVVIKEGVFNLVFHPHGWMQNTQLAELADYAIKKYGKSVKFMSFRDALEAMNAHLLAGQSVRTADGQDNGVRLIDLNGDGFQDVVIGNDKMRMTRLWIPAEKRWVQTSFPVPLVQRDEKGAVSDAGVRFGIVQMKGKPVVVAILMNEKQRSAWSFAEGMWHEDNSLVTGLPQDVLTSQAGRDRGVRLRDVDGDGSCELIVSNDAQQAIYHGNWGNDTPTGWSKASFALPAGTRIVDADGNDAGLRFPDIDEDGHADVIFSNDEGYSAHLYRDAKSGWSKQLRAGKRGQAKSNEELPRIVRVKGENNGVWFHSRAMWVQNEDTAALPNVVDVRLFAALLKDEMPTSRTPEASAKSIHMRPGFTAELVAAEPLVQDPINLNWDEQGRLWVIAMDDYPLGVDAKGTPGGHVSILTDTDGDGKYDKATVFMDGLNFPTGVTPWRKGAIITAAPEIFYAEDTDGDGKADKKEVLFTGFVQGNQQHRVNGLVLGLDNWLYGANGHSGGNVKSMKTGEVVELGGGRDFRIKPDEGIIEPETGVTQYGRTRDDWGNWFGCDNSNPNFNFVLPDHYLRRNPNITPPQARVEVPEVPGPSQIYPVSRILERFNEPHNLGRITSANSITIYRDDLFGPEFAGNSFVSEPVHNLIHREIMLPRGVTFTSHRAPDELKSEFLASTDGWARPTGMKTGPDGAIWFTDMYRLVIEHPEWIPKDWQARLDLRAGHDMGRIYRVYPTAKTPRKIPNLSKLDLKGLIAALDSPNGWQRDTIQRLLVDRKDKAAVPLLEEVVAESKNPLARLHALCTLDGMAMLSDDVVGRALGDVHPGVVRHAIRVAEPRFTKNSKLASLAAKHIDDEDPQVRLQLAFSLGYFPGDASGAHLAHMASKNANDPFITGAILSSVTKENLQPLMAALSKEGAVPPHLLQNLLRVASATGNTKSLAVLLAGIKKPEANAPLTVDECTSLAGLLNTLEAAASPLSKLAADPDPQIKEIVNSLVGTFTAARAVAGDVKAEEPIRAASARLLGRGPAQDHAADVKVLGEMLTPQTPESVQGAAIESLGRLGGDEALATLTAAWRGFGPAQRAVAMDAFLGREAWTQAAVAAMEKGKIRPIEVDAARRQRLLQSQNKELRARVEKVFAEVVKPDRQKVIEAFAPAASLEGDKSRGVAMFAKLCSTCHRLGEVGNAVGPDLAALNNKSSEYLMVQILDPNRAVDAKYTNYVLETKRNQTLSGILSAESGNSVTMVFADGKSQSILRSDLKSLRSTGTSLMPENLEAGLSPQDLADLMAFVRSAGPAPQRKTFPGNTPIAVQPAADGAIKLLAKTAEIYGPSMILEEKYGNLGFWTSDQDHAVWTVEPARPGKYAVWIEWACDNSSAGNSFAITSGASKVQAKSQSTGNWDTYKREKIGEITLRLGKQHLTVQSVGPVTGAIMDLKSIELIPATRE